MNSLTWPTINHTIGDGFGARSGEHHGIDIQVGNGTPVFAAAAGTVTFVGSSGGYGELIIINHSGGLQTFYAHLSNARVRTGNAVNDGTPIALSGGYKGAPGAGDSTGPHLHFEVRLNGTAINPLPLLNNIAPAALNKTTQLEESDEMKPYLINDGAAWYICVPNSKMIHIDGPGALSAIQRMLNGEQTFNLPDVQAIERHWVQIPS